MFDAGCNIAYAVHMHNAINDDQLLWRAKKDVCKKKNMGFQQSNLKWPRLQSCKEIRPDQEKKNKKNWGWIFLFLDRNEASLWLCSRAKCAAERHLGHENEQCELAQSSQWQGGRAGLLFDGPHASSLGNVSTEIWYIGLDKHAVTLKLRHFVIRQLRRETFLAALEVYGGGQTSRMLQC